MIILGIDPGSRFTGWGLVESDGRNSCRLAGGTLKLGESRPLAERLVTLAGELEAILEIHRPAHCAVEQIFAARNARSALVLGHARGVVLCAVARRGVELYEYAPNQVKQAVVGAGKADKTQVNRMVQVLLNYREPMGEDEADALALAITHAAAQRMAGVG